MKITLSKEREAPEKNKQQWLQSENVKTRRVLMRWIMLTLAGCLLCPLFNGAALGFTKNECVSRLTKEVDPQFRLSPAQAAARCDEISLRIAKLTKHIIGKWQRKGPKGKIETMEISADGTGRIHQYNA